MRVVNTTIRLLLCLLESVQVSISIARRRHFKEGSLCEGAHTLKIFIRLFNNHCCKEGCECHHQAIIMSAGECTSKHLYG
jgi:hypothetical protein